MAQSKVLIPMAGGNSTSPVGLKPIAVIAVPSSEMFEAWNLELEIALTHVSNLNRSKSKDTGWTMVSKILIPNTDKVAEVPRAQITSLSQTLDLRVVLPLSISSFQDIEDLIYLPLLLNFYESIPVVAKDKKRASEEKLELLGQCSVDLLALVKGQSEIEGAWIIFPAGPLQAVAEKNPPAVVSESDKPECRLAVRASKPVVPPFLDGKFNLITISLQAFYGFPETWLPPPNSKLAPSGYSVVTVLPRSSEHERTIAAPNKTILPKPTPQMTVKKWPHHPQVLGEAINKRERFPEKNYLAELGEFVEPSQWHERHEIEKQRPVVPILTEFRCVLSNNAEVAFRTQATSSMVWPFEIFEVAHQEVKHGGAAKKKGNHEVASPEDAVLPRHGVAFVDMKPLLYPGATSINGAYFVSPFDNNQFLAKTGRHSVALDMVKAATSNALSTKGTLDKDSRISVNAKKTTEHVPDRHSPSKLQEIGGNAAGEPESVMYQHSHTYLHLEIKLDRPLVEKKAHGETIVRLKSLIQPPEGPEIHHKESQGTVAEDALKKQMQSMCYLFADLLQHETAMHNKKSAESQQDTKEKVATGTDLRTDLKKVQEQMLYKIETRLTDSGDFSALKEQPKFHIIRLTQEKYKLTRPFSNPHDFDIFLSNIYVDLMQYAHFALDHVKRKCHDIPVDIQPPTDVQHLRVLALEAELDDDRTKAEEYFVQRTKAASTDLQMWQDLGQFYMRYDRYIEAEGAFKEMLLDDYTNFNGLLLNGYCYMEQGEVEKAGVFFESATLLYPKSPLSWITFGLFSQMKAVQRGQGSSEVVTGRAFAEASKTLGLESAHAEQYNEFLRAIAEEEAAETIVAAPSDTAKHPHLITPSHTTSGTSGMKTTPGKKDGKGAGAAVAETDKLRMDPTKLEVVFNHLSVPSQTKPDPPPPLENIFWYAICSFASLGLHKMTNLCMERLKNSCNIRDPVYWRASVLSLIEQRRYSNAEEFLSKLLEVDVETPDIFAYLGRVCCIQGRYKEAAENFRRAMSLSTTITDQFQMFYCYGRLSEKYHHFKKAKEMFYRAAVLHPTCQTWLGCGRACINEGKDLSLAENMLQEANYLDNKNPYVWAYLAILNYRVGRMEIADRCYQAAMTFGVSDVRNLMQEVEDAKRGSLLHATEE